MKTVVSKSKTMVFGAFAAVAVILSLGPGMVLAEIRQRRSVRLI